jgi:predicted lipid-binding transport protein (Tim44 family)
LARKKTLWTLSSAAAKSDVSVSLNKVGDVLVAQGDLAGARARFEQSLAIRQRLAAADPSFDGAPFLNGARSAYEMIVTSFARGDRDSLRALLSPEVFESFSGAIAAREAQGETAETTFVSIDKATIADAHLREGVGQITVRFASKLITLTRDRSGVVIDGGVDKIVDVIDVWTFARQAGARDPNWKLVATEAAH